MLHALLERLLGALDADRAAVVLTDGEECLVARAASGVATVVLRNGDAQVDDVVARVAAERGPVAILDVPGAGIDSSSLGVAITSLLAVPLIADGRIIGSLQVGTLTRHEFDEETVDLLRLAADRASLAIARTRLYERERRIAQKLQRSLLPAGSRPCPASRWPRVTCRARTARRSAATGTTRSRCRAGAWRLRSATSSAAASRRRRRWARCAAPCA